MLDTVITSEENRLAMGRALIDAQLENNSAAQAAEQKQYLLEQRILELEGRLAQELAAQVCMALLSGSTDWAHHVGPWVHNHLQWFTP